MMKRSSKNYFLTLLLLNLFSTSIVVAEEATMEREVGIADIEGPSGDSGPSVPAPTPEPVKTCPTLSNSTSMSDEALKKLLFVNPKQSPRFSMSPKGVFDFSIPSYYKECGDIRPSLSQIKGSNNYEVSLHVILGGKVQTYSELKACLIKNKVITETVTNGSKVEKISFKGIPGDQFSPAVASSASTAVSGFDPNRSSSIHYKWPKAFQESKNLQSSIPVLENLASYNLNNFETSCFSRHKDETLVGFKTVKDHWMDKVVLACKDYSADEIKKLKGDLAEVKEMKGLLAQITLALNGQQLKKSLEEAEDKFLKPLNSMEKKIGAGNLKRDKLIAEVDKYARLMAKMERDLVEPLQARINELKDSLLDEMTDAAKDKITDEIVALKEQMAKLYRGDKAHYNAMLQVLADEGISTQAKNIMVVNQKVLFYREVNNEKLKESKIPSMLKSFERQKVAQTNLWSDAYQVRNGNMEPYHRNARMLNAAQQRAQAQWKNEMENLQKKVNDACGVGKIFRIVTQADQLKCQTAVANAPAYKAQVEAKLVNSYGPRIQSLNENRTILAAGAQAYQNERAQNDDYSSNDMGGNFSNTILPSYADPMRGPASIDGPLGSGQFNMGTLPPLSNGFNGNSFQITQ